MSATTRSTDATPPIPAIALAVRDSDLIAWAERLGLA